MNHPLKFFLVLLISLAAGSATFAVAYSNLRATPPNDEDKKLSPAQIRNIHYTLGADPSQISAIEFDLDAPAGEVRVRFGEGESLPFACAHIGNNHWRCSLSGVSLASATELRVVTVSGR